MAEQRPPLRAGCVRIQGGTTKRKVGREPDGASEGQGGAAAEKRGARLALGKVSISSSKAKPAFAGASKSDWQTKDNYLALCQSFSRAGKLGKIRGLNPVLQLFPSVSSCFRRATLRQR